MIAQIDRLGLILGHGQVTRVSRFVLMSPLQVKRGLIKLKSTFCRATRLPMVIRFH